VYPDVFRAGAARAGVPAGCWADGYDDSQQWSNNCANGNTTKTAQQWGDLVRAMYPGYTGHRPRLQTYQGDMDPTISYKNTGESIKEWTNVMSLSTAPTSTDTGFKAQIATYNRQFWKNACDFAVFEAWTSPGGTHSMPYEEDNMLKFFGLDVAGAPDPETDCSGMGGMGGASSTGGMGGMGGMGTAAGSSGMGGTLGVGGNNASGAGPTAGGGGMAPSGGSGGSVVPPGGGAGGGGSGRANGGASATTSTGGTGGTTTGGSGMPGAAGGLAMGGGSGSGTGGTSAAGAEPEAPAGCGCTVGDSSQRRTYSAVLALGLAALAFRRRQRRAQG
jgi:MYXO-CTERM domain-containing protein